MIYSTAITPKVYIETTVVSYLVARPSNDVTLATRQRATRQLWEEHSGNFEFVVSDIVLTEAKRGDASAAERRLNALTGLTILYLSPEATALVQKLIDTGAVPQHFLVDAQHIAITAVHSVEYLVSWNYKHIVNEAKRQHINQVCQTAGYQPTLLCTPAELIEGIQMKEKLEPQTDPILEECYRVKEELSAQFNNAQELYDFLKAESVKHKAQGWKYSPPPPPPSKHRKKN